MPITLGNADDQRNDDVWADGRIHDQLGDDCGELTRDAAEEQRACEQPCPGQGYHRYDDTGDDPICSGSGVGAPNWYFACLGRGCDDGVMFPRPGAVPVIRTGQRRVDGQQTISAAVKALPRLRNPHLRGLQAETSAPAGNDVDGQLGVLPRLEL